MHPWPRTLGGWLRLLAILAGRRRIAPRWHERNPDASDTGGPTPEPASSSWYRATHRRQDPSSDPAEPNGSEGSSRGNDHGWSNCTMASGAMALDFHTLGRLKKWGGDLRHRQGDLEGGTDLYDVRDAWAAYGETLSIRSGAGWEALKADRSAGRTLVVQGSGNVPGSATFDGGHACVVGPETASDGDWLFGDPLASGWQWVSPSSIRTWMESWSSSLAYARTDAHPVSSGGGGGGGGGGGATPCPPCPECPPDLTPYDQAAVDRASALAVTMAGDETVRTWMAWLTADAAGPDARWDVGSWGAPADVAAAELDDPCAPPPGAPGRWARGGVPQPADDAYAAATTAAAWGVTSWRRATWI